MRRLLLFLLAAISCTAAEAPSLLDRGFHALYHLNFNEGRRLFEQWQRANPENPLGPAAISAAWLFEEFESHGVLTSEFFLDDDTLLGGVKGQPDERRMKAFREANERARQLSESILKRQGNDPDALLAMVMGYGMMANASSLIEKKQLEALRLTREGDTWGRRLLTAAPFLKDGHMALGASSYIIGCLPFYKRAIVRLGGIKGDKQKGIAELELTAREGRLLRPYAKIMLALAYLREKQPTQARHLLGQLVTEFPASPLFRREYNKIALAMKAR